MFLLEQIAITRTGMGISQAALADRVGVSRLAITRLEKGIGSVSLLIAVLRELEIRIAGVARGAKLPDQLRSKRVRLGLSQVEAGHRAELDARTINDLEAGRGTIQSLLKLMKAIAPQARKSSPPRASWAYDHANHAERDKRFTPSWFWQAVAAAFGTIDLDPCAHELSSVEARRKIILPCCGLASSWEGARLAYVNPPFSCVTTWMSRASDAWRNAEVEKIVMLVPCRTDSAIFQTVVAPDADVLFLAGRMRFDGPLGSTWPAPFSLMAIIWGATDAELEKFVLLAPAVRMRPRVDGIKD